MTAKKYDRRLGIRTTGLREWADHCHYNRYEATPYRALDRLFRFYKFKKEGRLVDFGCGRGRVAFYVHFKFKMPVVGIEAHDKIFADALDNKARYRLKARDIQAPLRFKYGLAEHYKIKAQDNCFYFFNPFSEQVFKTVAGNIMKAVAQVPRTVDLILYYPQPEYKSILANAGFFRLINKIKMPGGKDLQKKFLIYRFSPS